VLIGPVGAVTLDSAPFFSRPAPSVKLTPVSGSQPLCSSVIGSTGSPGSYALSRPGRPGLSPPASTTWLAATSAYDAQARATSVTW
jgi:hypothetical protein